MKSLSHLMGLAVICFELSCSTARADERIVSFDSDITVNQNASLVVRETIRVRAEGEQIKHGIYRDFPQVYRTRWGFHQRLGFRLKAVRRDGRPENYRTSPIDNGTRVYIGKSNVVIDPGEHTYELEYQTDRQLGFFNTHDELYWNVTGNSWDFPIDLASASVSLPRAAAIGKTTAYTGPKGSRAKHFKSEVLGNQARFQTTMRLWPGDGFTVALEWPKGVVDAPTTGQRVLWSLKDNFGILLGVCGLLLVLVYYSAVWSAVGRDPKAGVVIPLYEPPKGFSPAAVRFLMRMGFDDTCFAAALIGLAVKGVVRLDKDDSVFEVIRLDRVDPQLTSDEKAFVDALFVDSDKVRLVQKNHQKIRNTRKSLSLELKRVLERTYFVRNLIPWGFGLAFSMLPILVSLLIEAGTSERQGKLLFTLVWLTFWTLFLTALVSSCVDHWKSGRHSPAVMSTLFSLILFAGELIGLSFLATTVSIWGVAIFLLGAFLNGVFYHLLKAPTRIGRRILDQIEGFKRYLLVAEQNRLNLENPPERTPQLFEMFLPFAFALDVDQAWSEQFAKLLSQATLESDAGYHYSPTWVRGTGWDNRLGTARGFASLGASLSNAISTASTAPGSSSGSGGGGSSGGGGGGGGGGGW